MKTNIIAKNSIMKNVINRAIMAKKNVYKYICLVLLVIGTSTRAWATEETLDFTQCWGIGETYTEGVYTYNGYAINAYYAKYNHYNDYWILNYYYSDVSDHNGWGGIILPPFNGTVSSISVTSGSGSGATVRYIDLYVNGTKQASSTGIAAGGTFTFTSLSIAAGSTIELRNNTNNNEFHLASLSITHNGSQMGTAAVSGKSVVSASADGNGTVTVSSNPVSYDATTTLTAVPASGWQFDYWEVTSVGNTCTNYSPFSTRWTQNEFTADNIIGLSTDASIELYNFTYPDYFIAVAHFVETTCTIDTKVVFANSGTQNVNASTSAQTFDNAGTAKRVSNNANTGQTVTYTSSNPSVTVNASGRVSIPANFVGSVTITATAAENGDYCESSESYTLNVNGYDVTYHVKSCVSGKPANKTNYLGSLTLPTSLAVDGYQFVGWTTNSSYSDGGTPPALQSASITVSANVDLYAVWRKVSSKFMKMAANTALTAGDYVICTNYTGAATVMTNTLDGSKRMTTNNSDYTFDGNGDLSCNDEECIWTISGSTGNWILYNSSSKKYLSANNGTTDSPDRQMRLADASSTNFEKWIIAQKDASTVPYQVRNKGRVANNASDNGLGVSSGKIGYYASTGSLYFFKRTSTANAYTINPDCDAAEYTVRFDLSTAPAGTTVTASATGATFSSPVLAPVTAGTAVTIGVTAGTGYDFSNWTVVSGGASLTSAATVAGNGFEMPGANVVLRPNFTPKQYNIIYKNKGGTDFTGTPTPSPVKHTYGTETVLPGSFTGTGAKAGYTFAGWYTTSNCAAGTQVTSLGATAYTADITLYALWVIFTDPLAWCPEPEMTITGTTYITSMYHADNGGMVRGSAQLTVNARNMGISESITLTSDNSDVYFSLLNTDNIKRTAADKKPKTSITLTTDANGKLNGDEGQTVYVHYMPSALGDGSISDVTVTATYAVPDPDVVRTGHVYVRSMPAQFVMAAKVGDKWYALPNNVTEASNPQPLLIDVNETTWRASAPATAGFAMWPVETTNSDAAAYTEKGAWLRFAGQGGYGLWANNSSSKYTIKIDNSSSAMDNSHVTGNAYMWEAITTPQNALDPTAGTWIYNLQNHQTNNDNYLNIKTADVVWGTYNAANQLTKDIYLLPLDVVTPANMTVMEWAPTEIALKCADNTVLTDVTIGGEAVASPSLTSLGGDIYRLSGLPNLWNKKMQLMIIRVTEGGVAKQLTLKIPFIITDTQTAIDLRNFAIGTSQDARNEVIRNYDVVVRNAGQLNVTTGSEEATPCTFNNLYIYPGGKVEISYNDINVRNVYLRGGFSWLDNKATFLLPQMKVTDGVSITGIGSAGNGVYYDLYADYEKFYMIALPKTITLSQITNEENGDDFSARIKWYDGSLRAGANPMANCWIALTSGSAEIERGKGYEIAIKPRSAGVMAGRTIGILRFPLMKATAWTDEANCTPAVTAHGMTAGALNTGVTANNAGWNLMGNPFFSAFTATTSGLVIDSLTPHKVDGIWNGTYDWLPAEKVKYYTIPNKTDYDYTDARSASYKLEAFWPFFIQAQTTGALTFSAANRTLRAPAAQQSIREVSFDFILENSKGQSDLAGLNISDDYADIFDMDDKIKTIENGIEFLKVYTITDGYRIAFNSMSEAKAEQPIPVGYIAPTAGEYTFTIPQDFDFTNVSAINLTDRQEGITTDLIYSDYTFTTAKGQFDERFVLNVILRTPEIHTDIYNTESGSILDVKVFSSNGQLTVTGAPTDAQVYVYDIAGKLITQGRNAGLRVQLAVPSGVYNVRVVSGNGNVTTKVIVD